MKASTIVKLGTTLGLNFNRSDNFDDQYNQDIVVFNGANNQRFRIDGNLSTEEIHKELGKALVLMGMRLKAMHMESVMSIMSDTTELPHHMQEN